jgi:hypothetical protein
VLLCHANQNLQKNFEFCLGGGWTIIIGLKGGSASPKLAGLVVVNHPPCGPKGMAQPPLQILFYFFNSFFYYYYFLKKASKLKKEKKSVIMCRILNGVTCRWHEFLSVLNGKIDGDTISVFSHTTDTTYDKNKTLEAKNKIFKLHGAIVYLTLNFFSLRQILHFILISK